jgi:hypothetical protein
MMLIDILELELPKDWTQDAEKALEEIAALNPAERAEAINKKAELWSRLKPALAKLSHDKCWYSESKNVGSDNAVDHFRPKNNVKGTAKFPLADGHPGYWWLAFDYKNYRYACTFCNSARKDEEGVSGGKQDYFPLLNEASRAKSKQDDLDEELPLLLNPTDPADINALWFDEDGSAKPRPREEGEAEEMYKQWEERVQESIRLYHLDHPKFREERRILAKRVKECADEADKWLLKVKQGKDDAALKEYNSKLRALIRLVSPKSEYSRTAYCVLRGMRHSAAASTALQAR